MINKEDWAMIRALARRGVYLKDVAAELGVDRRTVRRALARGGPPEPRQSGVRPSKLDAFKPMVDELLKDDVWNAVVVFRKIQEAGYRGGISILRDYIGPKRPVQRSRATVRFETLPGRQLQNDWAEQPTEVGGRPCKVGLNVSVLGYSRRFYFWATDRMDAEHTYEGLIRAFEHFGGVPQEVLVDNQKAMVIQHRVGAAVRFNERFLDMAAHYGFSPRACRPYRARTKGKGERVIGYIKQHFFQRYRSFESLGHLNQVALEWLAREADLRVHGTVKEVVAQRFEREVPHLGVLPRVRYDTSYWEQRWVCWDGYIDVRGNRYSVPDELRGSQVRVRIGLDGSVRVYDGETTIVEHQLRPAQEGWVTVPEHHEGLWRSTLQVERRDLAVYEEAVRCSS